jgi:hypothetical protein
MAYYTFQNRNVCKTFNITNNGTLKALADQECSEVVVLCPIATTFYDYRNPAVGFLVPANTIFTFRGLTNSNQLSANGASGLLCYRTQYFSFLPGV